MSASKDTKRGTWKVYIRYKDWQGVGQVHTKRGFATKREALEYEREFLLKKSKDVNMVDENIKNAIKQGMKFGYIEQDGVKYGISEENISSIVDQDQCNAEMLERIINKFKNDDIEFKFKKNEEWKKKGYKDPEED